MCLIPILVGWRRVTCVCRRFSCLSLAVDALSRPALGQAHWSNGLVCPVAAFHVCILSGIKGVCGVYSGAPVKVTLCVTCYITSRVMVVHSPDEMRINGGCTIFFIFSFLCMASIREKTVSSVISVFLFSVLNFA